MSSALRAGLRVALNRPRVLGLAALVVAVETALRLVLGILHPLAFVLCPPVVAVPVLAAASPSVRAALTDPETAGAPGFASRLREHGVGLLAVATAGHVVALALGAALFLLVDTPVRYALYALGHGPLDWVVVYLAPLFGVAVGSLLAWGLLVPAAVATVEGRPLPDVVRAPVVAATVGSHRTGLVLALHVLAVAVVGGTVLTVLGYALVEATPLFFLVVGGLLGVFAATLAVWLSFPVAVGLVGTAPLEGEIPVRRLALAGLLFAALVAGAGAVRMTETRPGADLSPLPEEEGRTYAVALENTATTSYRVTYRQPDADGTVRLTRTRDRPDRQYRQREVIKGSNATLYAAPGVGYPALGQVEPFSLGERRVDRRTATAVPGYWQYANEVRPDSALGLPQAGSERWRVVERTDGTLTVELTDDDAVFEALTGVSARNASYETARIRMRVDADRGTLLGGRARLNASVEGSRVEVRNRYDVRTGERVDVERPESLGARTPGEWVWTLFAY